MTLLCAVIDEVAFLRDEQSASPDVELVRALLPALATTGGQLVGVSSPWARKGILWARYKRHFGRDESDVLLWQAPSATMNPGLSAAIIDEAREDDPEAAAAEWDATFRNDLESYVSSDVVDACTATGMVERPPRTDVAYTAFIDAAAGSGKDSFTAAVAHVEPRGDGGGLVVLDAVREVKPPFDPDAVADELAAFLLTYGCAAAQSDAYAGAWVVSAFQKHGVYVAQDAPPRSQVYLDALPLLTGQRADLLDLPRLRAQLVNLERRRRAGGRDVVDHPPGAHDDLANSAMGALRLAEERGHADGAVALTYVNPMRDRHLDPMGGGFGLYQRQRQLRDREWPQ